jgi:transcriptional regulator with XRE-family HTH domain
MRILYSREFPGIGEKIKEARKLSDKPLTFLCAEAGISSPHWHRIENEKVGEVPIETLRNIEKALNVDLGVEV